MTGELLKNAAHPSEEWPPLIPLDQPDLSSLNTDYLPGWAGDFARALSASTETPLEFVACMVLGTCAAATARRLCVKLKEDHREPCNLWIAAVLPSGNRKSAVQKAATAPLRDWERDRAATMEPDIQQRKSKRKTMEARIKEKRNNAAREMEHTKAIHLAGEIADMEAELPEIPTPPKLWISDTTPEKLGALLSENGECIAWLSSEGGIFEHLQGRYSGGIPNLDLVLKAWSGDPERIDRIGRSGVDLHDPLLTVAISPQPDVLRGLAGKPGFRGRGLLARFLYLVPKSPLGYRTLETKPVPEEIRDRYAEGIRDMLDWEPATDEHGNEKPHILELSTDAHTKWQGFERAIENKMRPDQAMHHCTDWAGKAPGTAARLAGVLHGIEHAHGKPWEELITAETMEKALKIMEVISQHSLVALDMMGADSGIHNARHVWEWVERGRRDIFTVRDAQQALKSKFPRVAQLREALEILKERFYLEIIEPEKTGTGRPPSPAVQVRSDIAEGWR